MANKASIIPAKFAQLVVKQTAVPTPKGNEILLKIHSAAINPVDYKIQKMGRFFEDFPRVLGSDVAGVVEQVGPEQKKFKKGDRVFSFIPIFASPKGETSFGGFQQYSLTYESGTGILPENITFDQGSTLPLALATAADGLYGFLKLAPPSSSPKDTGETVLVWGGASAVGQAAIQLLIASGYKVIATASSQWTDELKKLGATEVFDYKSASVVDEIKKKYELKYIYDSISVADSIKANIALLPNGGKIAFTQLTPETAKIECPDSISWVRVFAGSLVDYRADLGRTIFDWTSQALSAGNLQPNRVEVRDGGLDTLQDSFDHYEKNGIRFGKYVIHP